eukprot:CAMPEP_0196589834 /NCGR_PEP_ID=MMETSP1081-20130531/64767_1 /TAXON_ID=36882 /ORGANISM="Pyramimonas amylifera, Strain CCMP720" /LENGTH=65 /DNA_ID=CAMNT_0041912751 /DNA_START=217 /DNA_END=410 /DNA_ORIENTATION=-
MAPFAGELLSEPKRKTELGENDGEACGELVGEAVGDTEGSMPAKWFRMSLPDIFGFFTSELLGMT